MKYKLIINHIEKKDFNSKNLLFLNPLIPKANLLQKKKFLQIIKSHNNISRITKITYE